MKKLIVTIGLTLFLFTNGILAQEFLKTERTRKLEFQNESEKAEVTIKVTDEYNFMELRIQSKLKKGEMQVEVINTRGEVKGQFSIIAEGDIRKGKNTNIDSEVLGEMERFFRDPEKGDWIIRFTPKEAIGLALIRSVMIFNPKADVLEVEQIRKDTDKNILQK